MERIPIVIENVVPSFNLFGRLTGEDHENFKYIESQTNSRISLEGSDRDGILLGALYIRVENDDDEELHEARKLIVSLVNTVREEYRQSVPLIKSEPSRTSGSYYDIHSSDSSSALSVTGRTGGHPSIKTEFLDCVRDEINKEDQIEDNKTGFNPLLEKRIKVEVNPIIVYNKRERKSKRLNPIVYPLKNECPPISVLRCNDSKTFRPIEEWISPENLQDARNKVNVTVKANVKPLLFTVASYMSDGNYSVERKETIDKYLVDHNVDCACILGMISGCRNIRVEKEMGKTCTTNYVWHSTASLKWKGDVTLCILVRKDSQALLSNFKIRSNIVASAEVSVNDNRFTITCCFMPKNTNKRFNATVADLMCALSEVPVTNTHLLMGTFSSKILANDPSKSDNTEPETLRPLSGNGDLLRSLAVRYRLRLVSPFNTQEEDDLDKGSYIFLQTSPFYKTSSFHHWKPLSNQPIVACKIWL